ncbi:MAG: hypothetical protein IIZ61_05990 [Lachnospiraceae bacterium]|nr:hypothetical protein [Lachnospiraceae bacterium]
MSKFHNKETEKKQTDTLYVTEEEKKILNEVLELPQEQYDEIFDSQTQTYREEDAREIRLSEGIKAVNENLPDFFSSRKDLLGDKSFRDSDLMSKIKDDVTRIDDAIKSYELKNITAEAMEDLSVKYELAIISCRKYLDKRHSTRSRGMERRARVEAVYERLLAESAFLGYTRLDFQDVEKRMDIPATFAELFGIDNPLPAAKVEKTERPVQVKLSGAAEKVKSILNMEKLPSSRVKGRTRSSKKAEEANLIISIEKALRTFPMDDVYVTTINVDDEEVRLVQKSDNSLYIEENGNLVKLDLTASIITDRIRSDVMKNDELFGMKAALDIVDRISVNNAGKNAGLISRDDAVLQEVILKHADITRDMLSNVPTEQLKYMARMLLRNNKKGKQNIDAWLDRMDKYRDETVLTAKDVQLVDSYRNMNKEQVESHITINENVFAPKVVKEKKKWTEDEEKVKDLISDLIFSKDSVLSDKYKENPEERVVAVLRDHADTLALLIGDVFSTGARYDKLHERETEVSKTIAEKETELSETLANIKNMEEHPELKVVEIDYLFFTTTTDMYTPELKKRDDIKAEIEKLKKEQEEIKKKIRPKDSAYDPDLFDFDFDFSFDEKGNLVLENVIAGNEFKKIKKELEDALNQAESVVKENQSLPLEVEKEKTENQSANAEKLTIPLEEKVAPKGSDEVAKKKKKKPSPVKPPETLDSIIEGAAKGNLGMGRFMKLVMQNYFKEASTLDKRSMMSSLIRDMEPETDANEIPAEDVKYGLLERFMKKLPLDAMGDEKDLFIKGIDNIMAVRNKIFQSILNEEIKKTKINIKDLADPNDKEDIKKKIIARFKAMVKAINSEGGGLLGNLVDKNRAIKDRVNDILSDDEKIKEHAAEINKGIDGMVNSAMNTIQEITGSIAGEIFTSEEEKALKEEIEADVEEAIQEQAKEIIVEKVEKIAEEKAENNFIIEEKKEEKKEEQKEEKKEEVKEDKKEEKKEEEKKVDEKIEKVVDKVADVIVNPEEIKNVVENVVVDLETKKKQKSKKNNELAGKYLSAILKGAGPLMQKMMQGMPSSSMSPEMQEALKDTKENLLPIPEDVVKAQLIAMVQSSGGKVTHIEVLHSLGAASVGQAFMCKFYGPAYPEGKEMVVKLLRPDVRNKIEREKEVMLKCARETDKTGGMYRTYKGTLNKIMEELDFNIEKENTVAGYIYEGKSDFLKTSKICEDIVPSSGYMVLEKIEGETVQSYADKIKKMQKELMSQFRGPDGNIVRSLHFSKQKDYEEARRKLTEQLSMIEKRQQYITDLASQWVEEGVYGSGFYHGDLHEGNIMINDDCATIIDYGNVTQLNPKQREYIMRMMAASAVGGQNQIAVDDFYHCFCKLLSDKSTLSNEENNAKLKETFREILNMGDGPVDAAARIAAALIKAQELGFELPASVSGFSNCQQRLANTVDTMKKLAESVRESIEILDIIPPGEIDKRQAEDLNPLKIIRRLAATEHAIDQVEHSIEKRSKRLMNELGFVEKEELLREVRKTKKQAADQKLKLAEIDERADFDKNYMGGIMNMKAVYKTKYPIGLDEKGFIVKKEMEVNDKLIDSIETDLNAFIEKYKDMPENVVKLMVKETAYLFANLTFDKKRYRSYYLGNHVEEKYQGMTFEKFKEEAENNTPLYQTILYENAKSEYERRGLEKKYDGMTFDEFYETFKKYKDFNADKDMMRHKMTLDVFDASRDIYAGFNRLGTATLLTENVTDALVMRSKEKAKPYFDTLRRKVPMAFALADSLNALRKEQDKKRPDPKKIEALEEDFYNKYKAYNEETAKSNELFALIKIKMETMNDCFDFFDAEMVEMEQYSNCEEFQNFKVAYNALKEHMKDRETKQGEPKYEEDKSKLMDDFFEKYRLFVGREVGNQIKNAYSVKLENKRPMDTFFQLTGKVINKNWGKMFKALNLKKTWSYKKDLGIA